MSRPRTDIANNVWEDDQGTLWQSNGQTWTPYTPPTVAEQITAPFKRIPELLQQESAAGLAQTKRGWTDSNRLMAPVDFATGLLRTTFAPLTAVAEATYGEPITRALERGGVSPDVSQAISATGTGLLTGFAAALPIAGAKRVPRFDVVPDPEVLPPPPARPVAQLPTTLTGSGGIVPRLTTGVTNDVATAAVDAIQGNMDRSRRLFKQVADKLAQGEIQPESMPEILAKWQISPEQFAQVYADTVSASGKTLNQLSRLSKQLSKVFEGSPEAAALLSSSARETNTWDKVIEAWYRVENVRRGLLVTQMATAARNAFSQNARIALSASDEIFQSVIRGGTKGNMWKEISGTLEGFGAAWTKLSPQRQARLAEILESEGATLAKARLFSQPVHEATVRSGLAGKTGQVIDATVSGLNIFNRTQEYFFRKLAFEAKLIQLMQKRGLDYTRVDPSKIPQRVLEDAVDYAMEMTFSASPKGDAAKELVRVWSRIPGLTTINPFPRFQFGNALPFIVHHSPLGYAKMLSPATLKALASGRPEQFAKSASQATLGTLMLYSAWRLRQSEYAGEKWYELRTPGGKTIDMRPYAPFSTYLLFAEKFIHPERVTWKDWAEAAIGMNRLAGTGLMLADIIQSKDPETQDKIITRTIGEYAGSFTVPFRTGKDIVSGVIPEEGVVRDVRDAPIVPLPFGFGVNLGPAMRNIPFLSQTLPKAVSPLRQETIRTEHPILRQLTGVSLKTKNALEQELDMLQFDVTRVFPRTGVPEADREISRRMAPTLGAAFEALQVIPSYANGSAAMRRLLLARAIAESKIAAKEKLLKERPDLYLKARLNMVPDDVTTVIQELTGTSIQP